MAGTGWGSQFLIAPKCIFVPKTSQKRAFCNRPCALWLAHFLAADATSDFQTIIDAHAFSSEAFSSPNFVQNACHSRAYLQLRDTSAEHKGRFGGAHAHVPERAAVCRGAWKNGARWPSGLRLALQLAFTWPLHGPNLTHTQARHGAAPIYDCWQWRARCTLN